MDDTPRFTKYGMAAATRSAIRTAVLESRAPFIRVQSITTRLEIGEAVERDADGRGQIDRVDPAMHRDPHANVSEALGVRGQAFLLVSHKHRDPAAARTGGRERRER